MATPIGLTGAAKTPLLLLLSVTILLGTLNPFLWPRGGKDGKKSEAGYLSCCTKALATVPVYLDSHICLPHLHPSSLPVDRTRELLLSLGGHWGAGGSHRGQHCKSGRLTIQFGIHKSFSCILKSKTKHGHNMAVHFYH